MSLRGKQTGFTIVELLIVVVVIGILALLVITTFTGIQERTRNTERESDIEALHGQLEAYHAQHNRYPTLADFNDSNWRTTNMKTLNPKTLQDPKGSKQALVGSPTVNAYAYTVAPGGCDNSTADCASYTLTATLEGGGTFVKTALN